MKAVAIISTKIIIPVHHKYCLGYLYDLINNPFAICIYIQKNVIEAPLAWSDLMTQPLFMFFIMCCILSNAFSVDGEKCIAKKIPVSICILKKIPAKEPKLHQ